MNTQKQRYGSKTKNIRDFLKIYGVGLILGCIILVIAFQFVEPAPPRNLTIATASPEGAYYSYAQEYKKHFARQKINLEVLVTSGSVENLGLLEDKKVEVAFVQGGTGNLEEHGELEGLASLYLEPLMIFTRKELNITKIPELAGKKVAIGKEGSGTRKIALQLFADNNMVETKAPVTLPTGGKEGAEQLLQGQIDALFLVTRATSDLVTRLLTDPRTQLVSLTRAESYTRLHKYLSHIVLPEGVLDMERNIPKSDIHLIAPAATLVANKTLHPALADLLMQITAKVHAGGSLLSNDKEFPSPDYLDFPLNKEAKRYYKTGPPFLQRYLPFWAASMIDRLKVMLLPLVALIIPLVKVLPPTYRWRVRSRIYRWYDELHELDLSTREHQNQEVVENALQILDTMEQEVRLIEVPLSYAGELFNLRMHMDLLRKRIEKLL